MRDFLFPGVMRRLSSAKKDTHRQIQELVFSQTSLKIYGLYRDDGGRKVACVYIQSYNPGFR